MTAVASLGAATSFLARRGAIVALAVLWPLALAAPAPLAEPARACTALACDRCNALCEAYCTRQAETCREAGRRGCPGAYRSCSRGCTAELCLQCTPVQYGADGKARRPGRTELCRLDQAPGQPQR